jgi:hypothetical protein
MKDEELKEQLMKDVEEQPYKAEFKDWLKDTIENGSFVNISDMTREELEKFFSND